MADDEDWSPKWRWQGCTVGRWAQLRIRMAGIEYFKKRWRRGRHSSPDPLHSIPFCFPSAKTPNTYIPQQKYFFRLDYGITRIRTNAHLVANEDVVDGDVNELDEEADEAHDGKADAGGLGNGRELLPVGLGALLHQVHGVLGKLPEGLDDHIVETFVAGHVCKDL